MKNQLCDSMEETPVDLEDAPCPLQCIPNDKILFYASDRLHNLPGKFSVVQCKNCGLVRTNPRPTAETISFYYPADYAPYHAEPIQRASTPRSGIVRTIISRLFKKLLVNMDGRKLPILEPGTVLEIGCANGVYLDALKQQGWKTTGIEFSSAAANKARQAGHNVFTGSVFDVPDPDTEYDLIVAWMVLEHLHEPVEFLRRIRAWLKPGGYLVFSVPDINAKEFNIFKSRLYSLQVPAHLYHYTPRTLQTVLERSGWEIKKINWHKNPANLLRSIGYITNDAGWLRITSYMNEVAKGKRARIPRALLGILLGGIHQSGRITIWAQPKSEKHNNKATRS